MVLALILILLSIISAFLTGYLIHYARAKGMEDHPNARSSHQTPTPRGGGLAIVVSSYLGWGALITLGSVKPLQGLSLIVCSGIVAAVGWFDDRKGLSAQMRLLAHFTSAILFIFLCVGRNSLIAVEPHTFFTGIPVAIFSCLFLVWMTNLYNFMDGIDGLAAGEAATCAAWLAGMSFLVASPGSALMFGVLSATSLGFLIHNWQPAKIFMGDVGSGFLGFTFGALTILTATKSNHSLNLPIPMIVLAVFIVDSGFTLARRALRRQRVWQAHREHAYQHAVQSGYSHAAVTSIVLGINLIGLGPLALWAWAKPDQQWIAVGIAYFSLSAVAILFKAGSAN